MLFLLRAYYYKYMKACGATCNHQIAFVKLVQVVVLVLLVIRICQSMTRDKTIYEDFKDEKYFNSWNNGLVATSHIYHKYITKTYEEKNTFEKIQKRMYSVLDNHLNTDKGKAFVSQYEEYCVSQSIYRESIYMLLDQIWLSFLGDTLLHYIATTQ